MSLDTHDSGYKLLYSHGAMVRDLLTGFVPGDWINQLDFTSLEKCSGSYISDDLRDRADDLIWRVRWGPRWLYVYMLLEFQSQIDPWMAVRIQTYIGLLYQDLIRAEQLSAGGRLPPVLPLVLYNGATPWSAAREMEPLIEPGPPSLAPYRSQQGYLVLDERRLAAEGRAPERGQLRPGGCHGDRPTTARLAAGAGADRPASCLCGLVRARLSAAAPAQRFHAPNDRFVRGTTYAQRWYRNLD
jgi:hypothetical protein